MNEPAHDQELDCLGILCPLPILKTKKVIDTMRSGQVLKMLSTDAGSVNDMKAWTRATGNELIHQVVEGSVYTFWVRKT